MNEYQVKYNDGEVVEISAWTPEAAQAIAEEDAEFEGRLDRSVVGVELLIAHPTELYGLTRPLVGNGRSSARPMS